MKFFILILLPSLFYFNTSFAAISETPGPMKLLEVSCQEEIKNLCQNSKDPKSLITCLKKEDDKISIKCKEDLSRVFQSNKQMSSRGGGSMSSFGGFSLTPASSPSISYEGRTIPNQGTPSINENKLSFATPIYKNNGHSLSLSTQAGVLHLSQAPQLSSGVTIPKEYYRTEMGVNYMQTLAEKRSWGIRTSIGYNSDKLFQSSDDLSFSFSTHYSFPGSANSSWAVIMYLSNNGPFANYVPIPGFIYFYHTPTFTGIFGLPFLSLHWTPSFPWTYTFSLFGANINAEAAYGSVDHTQYFSGFNWVRQSYMLHDRANVKDRLSFDEKKLFIGVRSPLFNLLSSEFQLGDSFGRKIYIGRKFLNKDGGLECGRFLGSHKA